MDLQEVFPGSDEIPAGWRLDTWWCATRGTRATGLRRVHLNGNGTDHELRFLVFPPGDHWRSDRSLWPDCDRCHGKGRIARPQHAPSSLLSNLLEPGQPYDVADEEGLRRCDALNCSHGRTEPIYGASNSRIRIPGFPSHLTHKTGARGLSEPTRAEVIEVMFWCDTMHETLIHRRRSPGRYP